MEIEETEQYKGVDLLQAISTALLARNNIDDEAAAILRNIKVQQHHSRRIAETLLDYPSLRQELLERAAQGHIKEVSVSVHTSTGKTKPFWSFANYGVAELIINDR